MNFQEKSNDFFAFDYLGFSIVEFYISEINDLDGKEIVHQFINSDQDFEPARKYIGGYSCEHTNEKGETRIFMMYDFGSYPIDLLETNDYKVSTIKILQTDFDKLTSDFLNEVRQEINFIEFQSMAKKVFSDYEKSEFYMLSPAEWKFNENGAFQLSEFYCGFAIDRVEKILTVIQFGID